MQRRSNRMHLSALLIALMAVPCSSLDRPLFVPVPMVRAGDLSPSSVPFPGPGRPMLRHRTARVAAGSMSEIGREELDILKSTLDRMDERGVRCQQLDVHQQAQLLRYANVVAQQSSSDLSEKSATWALHGRWRLVLAPQEWTWLLAFSPGADVFVDVDTENETIDYAIHFPNRWQLLQRLQWKARFSLSPAASSFANDSGGSSRNVITFQILTLLAVIAGITFPLPAPRTSSMSRSIFTCFFDGDLWMDSSADGLAVYRYHGPVPTASDTPDPAEAAQPRGRMAALGSLLARALAIAALVCSSLVVMVPVLALSILVAAAASVFQALMRLRPGATGQNEPCSPAPSHC